MSALLPTIRLIIIIAAIGAELFVPDKNMIIVLAALSLVGWIVTRRQAENSHAEGYGQGFIDGKADGYLDGVAAGVKLVYLSAAGRELPPHVQSRQRTQDPPRTSSQSQRSGDH